MTPLLLLVHLAATAYLTGLCWLVQRVQYPLMARVGRERFADYERAHVRRIGPVVAPAMIVELATGILLLVAPAGDGVRGWPFGVSLGLLVAIWVSTFAVQVPLHRRLEAGFDDAAHAALVRTNWVRTLAWSLRSLLLIWILAG